jgi:2-amino-4-hydroxy-6-hydroxymethyldihydropteridine diphosphokinase
MPAIAYLGVGSNIDARTNIASGIAALQEAFGDVRLSPCYQSPSFGFTGADFINLVARVETGMSPLELKEFLHELEDRHQRRRDVPRFSDRTLDIDILLYGDLVLFSPALEIPRDEVLTAPHVLKPLADLAPDLRHPVKRRTFAELWAARDSSKTGLRKIVL